MLRNHVRKVEQRTLVSLLSTFTKCTETHIRRLRRCPFYNCFISGSRTNARGVAILLKENFSHKVIKFVPDKDGNYIYGDMQIENITLRIINVYAPNTATLLVFSNYRQPHFRKYIRSFDIMW